MIKMLCLIFLICFSTFTNAQDYLDVSVAAYHWNRKATVDNDFNEINAGVGFTRDVGDERWMAGFYKNSVRKYSTYVLYGYTPIKVGEVKIGFVVGGITGYQYMIVPAAGLLLTYQPSCNLGINLLATPNFPKNNVYGFLGLQLRFKL